MLSKAYYEGRLDLKYKTGLSKIREEYVLQMIELEELKKCLAITAQMEATLAASFQTEKAIKASFDTLAKYREIALPYFKKQVTVDKDEIGKLKAMHEKNREAFKQMLAVRNEPIETQHGS